MGTCRFCQKPAGLFRSQHADCATNYQAGRAQVVQSVTNAMRSGTDLRLLGTQVTAIERASYIPVAEHRALLLDGFDKAVDAFLDDGILDPDEERRVTQFGNHFGITQPEMQQRQSFHRVVKAAALRDVMSGIVPKRFDLTGSANVNLQKGEEIVWGFAGTRPLEDKTRRSFVGRSSGVSIRVMKGVYYRVGQFAGHPVETTERAHSDTGTLWATTKNLYFTGPSKSLRLPYAKIVAFEPYSDGLGVMKDAANAKAQVFVTGDGWFTYNLITNLAHLGT